MLGVKPLNQTELQVLDMCFMKERTRVLFNLCLYTGIRPQEALNLRVSDVAGQERLLLVKRLSKGKFRSRSILMHPALRQLLAAYIRTEDLQLDGPLFMARANRALSYGVALREFKEAISRANIKGKVGLHSGRKTFAAHAYERLGRDIFKAAKILGHADVKTTMSYLSFATEEADDVVDHVPWAP